MKHGFTPEEALAVIKAARLPETTDPEQREAALEEIETYVYDRDDDYFEKFTDPKELIADFDDKTQE